ncbi:MAG: dTMP kinase, partial [Alphaproteobacteria bacterium]|nr:dTMP kinase [Alphaproteobacteria bacterium]
MVQKKGQFIIFEGGEGAGKSTQVSRLSRSLRDLSLSVLETFEPYEPRKPYELRAPYDDSMLITGFTRSLLKNGAINSWGKHYAEAFLLAAARDEHLTHVIQPALSRGKWVICDRFSASTRAYQGAGRGLDDVKISQLETVIFLQETMPDLTLILDVPVETGFLRIKEKRQTPTDRF